MMNRRGNSGADVADDAAETNSDAGAIAPPSKTICACANFDFGQLQRAVSAHRGHSFEALLKETGAGRTCTACLLDLEYYFVALKARDFGNVSPVARDDADAAAQHRRSFKHRLYDWLDSISPPVAWSPPNRIPIVSGSAIECWLAITNHDLLFEKRTSSPLRTTVTVWNGEGKKMWRRRFRIPQREELRIRLDEDFAPGSGPLVVGSACVTTKAEHPAMRGTMRAQFEIVAAAGTCALHAQGDVGPGDTWFTVQYRPADERLFLVAVNTAPRRQTVTMSYPYSLGSEAEEGALSEPVALAPHGTRLHELRLPDRLRSHVGSEPFTIRARSEQPCSILLICASPALDRFSIIHR